MEPVRNGSRDTPGIFCEYTIVGANFKTDLREITGYTGEEAIGEHPRILTSGEMTDKYYEEMWDTLRDGEIFEAEVTHRRRNDELYHAQQTVAPIFREDDDDEFVAVQRDITEKKEQEGQLRRQKEQLENFASVVSHDLRNPLNVVQARVDLAQETCDTDHLGAASDAVDRSIDRRRNRDCS